MEQHSNVPYEIFTIDKLYTDCEIEQLSEYVEKARDDTRPFTFADFKNGKVIDTDLSSFMFEKVACHLPQVYKDSKQRQWQFVGAPKFVMYSKIKPGQSFPIHTDTGCEYDQKNNCFSKYTVLTYLNDDYHGGDTVFYTDDFQETVRIQPKKNRTLIFDIDLYHSGEAVTQGIKYWIGTELLCKNILE
jgi:hypothetical protein